MDLDDDQALKLVKAQMSKAYNAAMKRRRDCLLPGCKTKAIASHSQQRSRELRSIAKNGHVYAVTNDFATGIGNHSPSVVTRQGIGRATTFPGFCGKHDHELFQSIDSGALVPAERIAATFGLRALAQEFRKKQITLEALWEGVPKLGDALGRDRVEPLVGMVEGVELALRNEVSFYLRRFGVAAAGGAPDSMSFLWLVIGGNLGVSCTCALSLLFKESERQLLAAPELDRDRPIVAVSIVPDANQTHVIATWCRFDDQHSQYLRTELESHEDRPRLARFLNRLAFVESENTTIDPDIWESRSREEQEQVVRCFREIAFRSHLPDSELPGIVQLRDETISIHAFP